MIETIMNLCCAVWDFLCSLNDCPEGFIIAPIDPFTAVAAGIGAATSIGNAIFGGASARKQQREQQAAIDRQKAEEHAWFNRKYNEDATQRADAQRIINRANDAIKKRTQAAMGRKSVVGGTDASVAAMQQANAEQMGNAVSDIAARADAKKDAIEQGYRQRMSALNAQETTNMANYEAARRQNMANAASGVVNAAASVLANAGGGESATNNAPKMPSQENLKKMENTVNNMNNQNAINNLHKAAGGNIFDVANQAHDPSINFAQDKSSAYPSYYDKKKNVEYKDYASSKSAGYPGYYNK